MVLAPALHMLFGEGGDGMRMIRYEVRESQERDLTGLQIRHFWSYVLHAGIVTNTPTILYAYSLEDSS